MDSLRLTAAISVVTILSSCSRLLPADLSPTQTGNTTNSAEWVALRTGYLTYSKTSHLSATENLLRSNLDTLIKESHRSPSDALANVNALLQTLCESTNSCSRFMSDTANASFKAFGKLSVMDRHLRIVTLTNTCLLIRVMDKLHSGIDPTFNPNNRPANRIDIPLEFADKPNQYKITPEGSNATMRLRREIDIYRDQADRRDYYKELLHGLILFRSGFPKHSEYAETIEKAIRETDIPKDDKDKLLSNLIKQR